MTEFSTDYGIRTIAGLQDSTGLFPSFRSNPAIFYRRLDTNMFFTASTVFVLQSLRSVRSPESQQLISQISENAERAYARFQNKDGLDTYNFWPTRPSRHFPNGHIFRHFEHFRIPDDIDDTAMVYLTQRSNPPSTDRLNWLKAKLAQHANGSQRHPIKNTYPDYRTLRAYSTWFGKNMGIDFDACALSNILYCIYQFKLPRNQHDSDALLYLRSVVESGRYTDEPFRCAPHYARASLIIYHLARLMGDFMIPELEPIRARLVADAVHELKKASNRIEQMILASSLLRLGEATPRIDTNAIEREFSTFTFFIAGLLTAYEQPWLRRFADRPLMQMQWHCEAHCWALVTEYNDLLISAA
ncbi:hypothetical protein [Spirosoma agri]|uniref:Uncharacterized protein n=1 Tax=Spirosoma agri TaxID=1987381 RepID=A0A6M0IKX1_9BACT|nr:hypothetical protein [Spirosoma agri]NEU68920.1 hypothetical protein [Spirosoma agri]